MSSPGTNAGQKQQFFIKALAKTPKFSHSTNAPNTQNPESRTP
jgi:hypothetical protein